jgi:hypothetical protein
MNNDQHKNDSGGDNEKEKKTHEWVAKEYVLNLLAISDSTLRRMRKKFPLPAYKITGKLYFEKSEVNEFVKQCSILPRKPGSNSNPAT